MPNRKHRSNKHANREKRAELSSKETSLPAAEPIADVLDKTLASISSSEKTIDDLIPKAVEVLESGKLGILKASNGEGVRYIEKGCRGKLAAFGAAVVTGSLLSAVALYSDEKKSADSPKLMEAILQILELGSKPNESLFDYVSAEKKENSEAQAKKKILNAAVALKLAMRLYPEGSEESRSLGGDVNGS